MPSSPIDFLPAILGLALGSAPDQAAEAALPSPDMVIVREAPWDQALLRASTTGIPFYAAVLEGPHGLLLRVDIRDLSPGFHGLHLHRVADCSDPEDGFKASGGHINPTGKAHGLLNPVGFHVADLPNVHAANDERAVAAFFLEGVKMSDLMDSDGFALIVHANPDDHFSQPIGGAGGRLGCVAFPAS